MMSWWWSFRPPRTTLRLGRRLLRIVRCVDVRHCKWTHRAHRNERDNLRGGEVVCVRRDGPRVANLHRLGLRGIEGIAHADEERPLLDRDRLRGGMEVGRDLVAGWEGGVDRERRRLSGG